MVLLIFFLRLSSFPFQVCGCTAASIVVVYGQNVCFGGQQQNAGRACTLGIFSNSVEHRLLGGQGSSVVALNKKGCDTDGVSLLPVSWSW